MHTAPADSSAPRLRVEAEGQRRARGGRRGRASRSTVRQINAKAIERQSAWLETKQPFLTARLTGELDELYDDLRDDRKGRPGAPFKGKTWRVN